MPSGGSNQHGLAELDRGTCFSCFFSSFIDSMGLHVYAHKIEFHEVDGQDDFAFARGKYAESFTVNEVEGTIEDSGKVLATLRRQADGSWRFSRWMWNSDLPSP